MYYCIVNPGSRAGKGMHIWKETEAILKAYKIRYKAFFTDHEFHACELARMLCGSAHPFTLIVLGGDGTLNEVLQGITDPSLVTLMCIPIGSGNDFAKGLSIPSDPANAIETMLHPASVLSMDIGMIRSETDGEIRYFAGSSGIGFDAAVCHAALRSPVKNFLTRLHLEKFTYVGTAILQILAYHPCRTRVTIDGERMLTFPRTFFICAMNLPYEGGGLKMTPDADGADGQLDVCIVDSIPKALVLLLLPTAFFGKHAVFRRFVTILRCREISILADRPLPVHSDGESFGLRRTVTIRTAKNKIRVITGKI